MTRRSRGAGATLSTARAAPARGRGRGGRGGTVAGAAAGAAAGGPTGGRVPGSSGSAIGLTHGRGRGGARGGRGGGGRGSGVGRDASGTFTSIANSHHAHASAGAAAAAGSSAGNDDYEPGAFGSFSDVLLAGAPPLGLAFSAAAQASRSRTPTANLPDIATFPPASLGLQAAPAHAFGGHTSAGAHAEVVFEPGYAASALAGRVSSGSTSGSTSTFGAAAAAGAGAGASSTAIVPAGASLPSPAPAGLALTLSRSLGMGGGMGLGPLLPAGAARLASVMAGVPATSPALRYSLRAIADSGWVATTASHPLCLRTRTPRCLCSLLLLLARYRDSRCDCCFCALRNPSCPSLRPLSAAPSTASGPASP